MAIENNNLREILAQIESDQIEIIDHLQLIENSEIDLRENPEQNQAFLSAVAEIEARETRIADLIAAIKDGADFQTPRKSQVD